MGNPSPEKRAEWRERAAKQRAIVPHYFVVRPHQVLITCGNCRTEFTRPLVTNRNFPVFVCPNKQCAKRNWIPVSFDLSNNPHQR